ncbi:MAG: phosphoribosylformylglycinamidine synthase subunit PurQ [Sphingobacteriales bacterium]|jgi:phosphoribosylformylglycinamidine synthase I|nr:phosphoribosylformylglycinamidine synthase subunit PurQ [Sphingobacteriales bacterium]MBP9141112.1 phosphoribosylformylglycinamidine synthase subunit PurQ [Chitinophagales bacterium]MDA0197716.1 phosphoribosylformylglycinamidine synthase subunit PurQ [Bacteroidota bacterium]MBK6888814.1 phosphoribosylformylglycinamidine synthase subunit PurQ [Sphingobacteriales bacterium]MBK7528679.1 phosphoribosylformylglycinamidine synthase subunit PurQ [Sphingobacteriales bacterium]
MTNNITVKALVITGYGINCEEEMAAAYQFSGAKADIVFINDILEGDISIHDYDIVNFPGGFSFGDDISSGKVLANKIKFKQLTSGKTLLDELQIFLNNGKFVMGVCNGFQVLVKLGLLPNIAGNFAPETTLTNNNSGKYEDRWVYCKVNPNSKTPFLSGIDKIALPVRHGEGRLLIKNDSLRQQIIEQNLNCLSYCDAAGTITGEYPLNPNGAELNCAGLCSPNGQVFGLMPHPEAFLSFYNHPNWGQLKRQNPNHTEDGEGLQIFRNIVAHIKLQYLQAVAL